MGKLEQSAPSESAGTLLINEIQNEFEQHFSQPPCGRGERDFIAEGFVVNVSKQNTQASASQEPGAFF